MAHEGDPNSIPNGTQTNEPTDLEKRLKALEETNKRLLEESKKYKEKAKTYESELEQLQTGSLEKEKDVSKVLEAERKRLEKIANENKKLKQTTLQTNIYNTIQRYATDVVDIEDLLNQPKYAELLKRGIDADNLVLDEEVAKEYVETVLKAKPYLRKSPEATTMMTRKPGFNPDGAKSIDQMSGSEIENLIRQQFGKQ